MTKKTEQKPMSRLTKAQKQAYLKASHKCPYCGSDNIEGGEHDYSGDMVFQDVVCRDCEKSWTDEYTLTGITESEES